MAIIDVDYYPEHIDIEETQMIASTEVENHVVPTEVDTKDG